MSHSFSARLNKGLESAFLSTTKLPFMDLVSSEWIEGPDGQYYKREYSPDLATFLKTAEAAKLIKVKVVISYQTYPYGRFAVMRRYRAKGAPNEIRR